jgi:hypothetical protein
MSETELWEISNSDLEFKKEHNKDTLSKDDESYLNSDKEFNEDFIVLIRTQLILMISLNTLIKGN